MKCKKCQTVIPEEALYCPSCGARADGNKPCPSCEKLIPDESVFCVFCGERVDGNKICHKCLKPVPLKAIYCSYCRAKLDEKQYCSNCGEEFEGLFCPMCGTPYVEKVIEENVQKKTVNKPVEPVIQEVTAQPTVAPAIIPIPVVVPAVGVNSVNSATKNQVQEPVATKAIEETAQTEDALCEEEAIEETQAEVDVTKNTLNAIVCSQCGSSNVDLIAEDLAVCKNCGTNIVINVEKEQTTINNTVNINLENNYGDTPLTFYALPKLSDTKTFLANAITALALDKETPEDIISASTFEPVKTEYRHYLISNGTANMSYSATVGYDYKVTYTEYSNGKPVQKTKTETKWEPFSGTHVGDYKKAVPNDNGETSDAAVYLIHNNVNNEAVELSQVNFETQTPNAPCKESIELVKSAIKYAAERDCEASLPGHRHKQFNCHGTVALHEVECHVAPQNILTYKYKNETNKLYAHTFSTYTVSGTKVNAKAETLGELEEKIKIFNIGTLALLLISIILVFAVKNPTVVIIFGSLSIASFIALEIYRGITKKNIYARKRAIKIQNALAYLKLKKLPVPSKLEEALVPAKGVKSND